MYSKSHTIVYKEKCTSVAYSNSGLFLVSSGKASNIFKQDDLVENSTSQLVSLYAIYHQNDVVCSSFNKNASLLCISDFDSQLVIYDLNSSCKSIYKSDSEICKI